MDQQIASRFLDEVPHASCKFEQAQNWQQYDVNNYFTQWTGLRSVNSEVFTFTAPATATAQERSKLQPIIQKPTSTTAPSKTPESKSQFKKHQTIKHKTFGLGIVKEVEQKNGKTFVTVHFKTGTKKIEESFLEALIKE